MMRKFMAIHLFLLAWCGSPSRLIACSAVASREAFGYMGANYDWRARGGIVFESPRGQVKQAISASTNQPTMTWTSRLASLTVSQFGRDFPMQGMNEAGLSGVVLMGQAGYPNAGPRGIVTENLWLQYQLDQYETVAEVVAHASDLGIEKLSASLHWFFCDRSHACAVIEFHDGAARSYSAETLEVRALTNSGYDAAVRRYDDWVVAAEPLPQGYDSLARFIRLAEASGRADFGAFPGSVMAALELVAANGYTAWQTIFDLDMTRLRIKLPGTAKMGSGWRDYDVGSAARRCGLELRMMVLGRDETWQAYDPIIVEAMFADAAKGTQGLDAATRKRILRMSEAVVCDW